MLLLLNSLIVIGYSILLLAILRIEKIIPYILGVFLISWGSVVLIVEILSLLHWLTPNNVFISQLAVFGLSVSAWVYFEKPDIIKPFRGKRIEIKALFEGLKKNIPITVFGILIVALLAQVFINAAITYNIVNDARFYHLPRIAVWMQNQSIFATADVAQRFYRPSPIVSPPNSHIGYMWVFFWTSRLLAVDLVEVAAGIVLGFAIFGIGHELSGKKRPAVWAALLFFSTAIIRWSMEQTIAMVSSTCFFIISLFFLIRIDKAQKKTDVFFFCLALALAVGAKPTIYYMCAVAIFAIPVVIIRGMKKLPTKKGRLTWGGFWILCGGVCLLLFGSGMLIQNTLIYRHPIPALSENRADKNSDSPADFLICGTTNAARYAYLQLIPLSNALGDLAGEKRYFTLLRNVFEKLDLENEKNCSITPFRFEADNIPPVLYQGWAYIVLVIPGVAISLYQTYKQKDFKRMLLLSFWAMFWILLSASRKFHEGNLRYAILPGAILFTLFVDFLSKVDAKRGWQFVLLAIGLLSIWPINIKTFQINEKDLRLAISGQAEEAYLARHSPYSLIDSFLEDNSQVLLFSRTKTPVEAFGLRFERHITFTADISLFEKELLTHDYDYVIYLAPHPGNHYSQYEYPLGYGISVNDAEKRDAASYIEQYYKLEYVSDYPIGGVNAVQIFRRKENAPNDQGDNWGASIFPPKNPMFIIETELESAVRFGPLFIENVAGKQTNGDRIVFELISKYPNQTVLLEIKQDARGEINKGKITVTNFLNDNIMPIAEQSARIDSESSETVYLPITLGEGKNYIELNAKDMYFPSIRVKPDETTQ